MNNLSIYLTFNGNCQEAMGFYQEIFQDTLDSRTYEGSPVEVPEEYKHKVLHARLDIGGAYLMASDGMPGTQANMGDATHISISVGETEEAKRIFDRLSQEGTIKMPLQKTFWSPLFGMLTDKFGVHWMIDTEPSQT